MSVEAMSAEAMSASIRERRQLDAVEAPPQSRVVKSLLAPNGPTPATLVAASA
jgi:hypothetical protein